MAVAQLEKERERERGRVRACVNVWVVGVRGASCGPQQCLGRRSSGGGGAGQMARRGVVARCAPLAAAAAAPPQLCRLLYLSARDAHVGASTRGVDAPARDRAVDLGHRRLDLGEAGLGRLGGARLGVDLRLEVVALALRLFWVCLRGARVFQWFGCACLRCLVFECVRFAVRGCVWVRGRGRVSASSPCVLHTLLIAPVSQPPPARPTARSNGTHLGERVLQRRALRALRRDARRRRGRRGAL